MSPRPSDEMPPEALKPLAWPFPSKDNPLKPWTPEQIKEYNDKLNQESPF